MSDISVLNPLDISHKAPDPPPSDDNGANSGPAVRFKSTVQEIAAPENVSSSLPPIKDSPLSEPADVTPAQLRELSKSLQGTHLQERRMNIFSFEPFSLPASRVRPCKTAVFNSIPSVLMSPRPLASIALS